MFSMEQICFCFVFWRGRAILMYRPTWITPPPVTSMMFINLTLTSDWNPEVAASRAHAARVYLRRERSISCKCSKMTQGPTLLFGGGAAASAERGSKCNVTEVFRSPVKCNQPRERATMTGKVDDKTASLPCSLLAATELANIKATVGNSLVILLELLLSLGRGDRSTAITVSACLLACVCEL